MIHAGSLKRSLSKNITAAVLAIVLVQLLSLLAIHFTGYSFYVFAAWSLASILVGLLAIFFLRSAIVKPLRDISAVLHEGDFSQRTSVSSNDELGELSERYNAHASNVGEMLAASKQSGLKIAVESAKVAKRVGEREDLRF